MAGGWGSAKSGFRLGVFWTGTETRSGGSEGRLTGGTVRLRRAYNTVDTSNSLSVSGSAVVNDSWSNRNLSGDGDMTIVSVVGEWRPLSYGSTTTAYFTADLSGLDVVSGGTLTVTEAVTLPARPYDTPDTQTGVTVARVSDTQQTVSWTRHASTGAPYSKQYLYRRLGSGEWAQIATLSGTATSYADKSTVANAKYDYRLRAYNSAGYSSYSSTASIYTTPAAPVNASISKSGTTITINWVDQSAYETGFEVEESTTGPLGTYSPLATKGAGATAHIHTGASNVATHTYRIRAVAGSLSSGWLVTQTVSLLAKPNPPLVNVPDVLDLEAEPLPIGVTHQPIDSTDQTALEIRYRPLSGTTSGETVALFGDSLVEGMLYTTDYTETVGMRARTVMRQPRRVWVPPLTDEYCAYETSSRQYETAVWSYSGVPFANRIESSGGITFPLPIVARARVWVRRDDGSGFTGGTVTVTSSNAGPVTLSGAQTDPTGYGVESITVDNPGASLTATFTGGTGEILGVELWEQIGSAPSAMFAFGVSGQTSDGWQDSVHRWRTLSPLLAKLDVTTVIISIMDNDANAAVPAATFQANIATGIDHIRDHLPTVKIVGVRMPNIDGKNMTPYNNALATLCDSMIDATTMPLNSTTVGADGTHWTNAGNEAFASIIRSSLNPAGSGPWTTVALTTQTLYTIPAGTLNNGVAYEVQARTKGGHADWSNWSASELIKGASDPQVTISYPVDGGTVSNSTADLSWSYFQADGVPQAAWEAELHDAADWLETKTGIGGATTATFDSALRDGESYTYRLRVQSGDGAWSEWAEVTSTVDFLPPPTPEVEATFGPDDGSVELSITVPGPEDGTEVAAVTISVRRRDGDRWVTLLAETPIPEEGELSIIDRIPPLATAVDYEVVTVSGTPSTAVAAVPVDTRGSRWIFVNGGPGWETSAKVIGNISGDVTVSYSKDLRYYAGRTLPVEHMGRSRSTAFQLSGTVAVAEDSNAAAVLAGIQAWRTVAALPAPLCVRDGWSGERLFVSIGEVQRSLGADTTDISTTLTEVGGDG